MLKNYIFKASYVFFLYLNLEQNIQEGSISLKHSFQSFKENSEKKDET